MWRVPALRGTIVSVADMDTRLREQPSLVASPQEPPPPMGTPCLPSAPLHRAEAGSGQGKGLLLVLLLLYYKPQLSRVRRGCEAVQDPSGQREKPR